MQNGFFPVGDSRRNRTSHAGENKLLRKRTLSVSSRLDLPNLSNLGITEGKRFIFGGLDTEDVKKLKIEGQSPTGIIEFPLYGEKRYFWYYENLISDKPSSEFNIEIEE